MRCETQKNKSFRIGLKVIGGCFRYYWEVVQEILRLQSLYSLRYRLQKNFILYMRCETQKNKSFRIGPKVIGGCSRYYWEVVQEILRLQSLYSLRYRLQKNFILYMRCETQKNKSFRIGLKVIGGCSRYYWEVVQGILRLQSLYSLRYRLQKNFILYMRCETQKNKSFRIGLKVIGGCSRYYWEVVQEILRLQSLYSLRYRLQKNFILYMRCETQKNKSFRIGLKVIGGCSRYYWEVVQEILRLQSLYSLRYRLQKNFILYMRCETQKNKSFRIGPKVDWGLFQILLGSRTRNITPLEPLFIALSSLEKFHIIYAL